MNLNTRGRNWNDEQMKYIISLDGGWIIKNLFTYYNSLVPMRYVKEFGLDCVVGRLERFTGFQIDIEESITGQDYIASVHR